MEDPILQNLKVRFGEFYFWKWFSRGAEKDFNVLDLFRKMVENAISSPTIRNNISSDMSFLLFCVYGNPWTKAYNLRKFQVNLKKRTKFWRKLQQFKMTYLKLCLFNPKNQIKFEYLKTSFLKICQSNALKLRRFLVFKNDIS